MRASFITSAECRARRPAPETRAKLGIGECGTTRSEAKSEFIHRYYGPSVPEPRFIGGQFWWYFVTDMVPASKPLWSELAAAMK